MSVQPICLMKGHSKFDFINRGRCHLGGPNQLSAAGQKDVAKALTREQLVPRKKVRVVDQVEDIGAVEIRRALPEGLSPVVNFLWDSSERTRPQRRRDTLLGKNSK